ncbi:microtubule-associated protein futsch-like [Paralichthys olivaceus]|uniref:microtubule-associated protein futsch-like n=1 Tax=Paralichthys olivaceus TaxID=8255 RepID=UPI00097D7CA6|nr:PREDICTED: uncharacterized protein LOC109639740 [Paralichthys olivaceus]
MAEECGANEPEELGTRLHALSGRYSSEELRADSGAFCADFCELVEEFASRWQVPLPQLRILEIALRYFSRSSTFFASNCDHVLHTLSSLALSVFELLLFFDQKDFHQEPLKHFTVTFQECHSVLARYQNVHLLQVERLVQGHGPWSNSVLQGILSESSLPQNDVDGCITAELPVFFELRVRYLLSCERVSEAMALARCCARHPMAGRHLFFLQVYLTWLYKTSKHDRLHKEVDDVNSKDAVHIICSLECEEQDDLLLGLSRAFLSQQLRRGDMYYLCDLVFIWSKLHSRLNTSKQALWAESHQLMLCATNVNSIFPFIRAILQELGEDGRQFCVELCTNALESCLPCDVVTKSLIYKTIAGLLPNDLEVCRACALLVFFQERTVEAYKRVYLLYMHPDQEYHVEYSPIRNNVRFEMLQVLKKDLYFDPEFWNLIALRTNCLKLMSEKVVSAALEEIMEDKWISNYSTKEPASRSSSCRRGKKGALQAASKKRHQRNDTDTASKRLKVGPDKTQLNDDHAVKKKGTHGLRPLKNKSSEPLRRSFWRLDRIQDNVTIRYGEHRRITRLSEKNPPKRSIRKPRWLLEDSNTLQKNNVPPNIKKHELRHQQHHRSSVMKRPETGQIKNNAKHKPPVNSHLSTKDISKHQREFSLDYVKPAPPPQVILELSLPDNELLGTFTEDSCNRQRGFPQVLLYKPTVKPSATSQPVKTVHRKEVVLRARDAAMFVKQLHCYARRQKGKGHGLNVHGSVSTITRSSVQGSPPKDAPREHCKKPEGKGASRTLSEVNSPPVLEKVHPVSQKTSAARESADAPQTPAGAKVTKSPGSDKVTQPASRGKVLRGVTSARDKSAVEMKATTASQTSEEAEGTGNPVLDKIMQAQTTSARELCEEPAVEMKVTIASQTSSAAKVPQSPGLGICKPQSVEDLSKITASAEGSQTTSADNTQSIVNNETPPFPDIANNSNTADADPLPSRTQDVVLRDGEKDLKSPSSLAERIPAAKAEADTPEVLNTVCNRITEADLHTPCERDAIPRGNMVPLSKASEPLATYSPPDQDAMNDISALTLVTEMVTELAPEALAQDLENDKQRAPENSAYKDSTAKSKTKVPHKIRSTSSCSVPAQEASTVSDVQLKKGTTDTQDIDSDASENSEPETEESKLEFNCTFCDKFFKGSRVVAHAMFHYRKDECMFCRTMFKDDLLAMMHLSDHIEKLKKSKDQENRVSETKGISTLKISAKDNATNMSPARRGRGRPRKSAVVPESVSLQDPRPHESRKLRSKEKPADEKLSQEKKQNTSEHLRSETPVHKVNGHVGKKKELGHVGKKKGIVRARKDLEAKPQQEKSQERTSNGSENRELSEKDKKIKTGSLSYLKATTKKKNVEPQEKVCCPVDGCVWFKDLSKNRVALLYHALDDHYGELKPLELAFRVGNSRCSICMRVLWSFKHFQHHVERHRVSPRHPCLHQGCPARFKSGMEMRRHTRRHSPLQAVCCLPGCSQLFICLWALNLHEREHYTSKPTKPDKITSEQTSDKHNKTAVGRTQQDNEPKDAGALNKTVSLKACKLRRRATHKSSSRKHMKAPPFSRVREFKERNETEDSNVLKNLSNKDTTAQPSVPNLRLRQTLRKVQITNTTMAARKVISSSLKRNNKVRHKFKKHQVKINTDVPKRRGRPPKLKKSVHDENTSTGQNSETVKEKTALQKDPKAPAELSSPSPKAAADVGDGTKEHEVNKTTKTSDNESKCKKSVNKQIKKCHIKQMVLHDPQTSAVTSNSLNPSISRSSVDKTRKSTTDKVKKVNKAKRRSSLESGCQSAASNSNESKKCKVKKGKFDTKTESALKKTVESKAVVVDEDGKAKTENKDTVPAVALDSLNQATSPSTTSGVTNEEKSSKSQFTKKERPKESSAKTTSSDADKVKKKQKDVIKKADKKTVKEKQPCKDPSKTPVKKKSKSVVQQEEGTKAVAALDKSNQNEEGTVKDEASDATLSSSGSSVPADTSSLNEKTSATEENTQKMKELKKNSDPNKDSKKHKSIHKEGDAKSFKKSKGDDAPSAKPSKTEVKPLSEVKAKVEESSVGQEGAALAETPPCPISSSGYSIMNGKALDRVVKSTVCKDTLAMYGKKPYMRLPPTAYLDEKYITMPKRRKEMTLFESSQRSPPPGQACVAAAQQRQRCANCFATFNSAEDLQGHLQLQRCSNLFGFDSDDEGNS